MTPAQVETIYEALAIRLDRIHASQRDLYLAKLVLLLARDVENIDLVLRRLEEAAGNLEG